MVTLTKPDRVVTDSVTRGFAQHDRTRIHELGAWALQYAFGFLDALGAEEQFAIDTAHEFADRYRRIAAYAFAGFTGSRGPIDDAWREYWAPRADRFPRGEGATE